MIKGILIVSTLAIRDTAEERMVARKEDFKGSRDKIPKLIEEAGMRHFIAVCEIAWCHIPTNRMVRIQNSLRLDQNCSLVWMCHLSNSIKQLSVLKKTPPLVWEQLTILRDPRSEFGSLALNHPIVTLRWILKRIRAFPNLHK